MRSILTLLLVGALLFPLAAQAQEEQTRDVTVTFKLTLHGEVPESDAFELGGSVYVCTENGILCGGEAAYSSLTPVCGPRRAFESPPQKIEPCKGGGTVYTLPETFIPFEPSDDLVSNRLGYAFARRYPLPNGRYEEQVFHRGEERLERADTIAAEYTYDEVKSGQEMPDSMPRTGGGGATGTGDHVSLVGVINEANPTQEDHGMRWTSLMPTAVLASTLIVKIVTAQDFQGGQGPTFQLTINGPAPSDEAFVVQYNECFGDICEQALKVLAFCGPEDLLPPLQDAKPCNGGGTTYTRQSPSGADHIQYTFVRIYGGSGGARESKRFEGSGEQLVTADGIYSATYTYPSRNDGKPVEQVPQTGNGGMAGGYLAMVAASIVVLLVLVSTGGYRILKRRKS
ncbi:MAG: hypothetical protein M3P51_13900 [Chloroflexota bacterium]|nr:hypothetical protein [Chloroflexota bacterium]